MTLRAEDRRLLRLDGVREAMRLRCDEQGHEYESGLTVFLRVVRICKWCGDRR